MLLITHIIIATLSVISATVLFFSPSSLKFRLNYWMIAATLISGTVLVVNRHSHLMESCMLGIVYIGGVLFAIVAAKKKMARESL